MLSAKSWPEKSSSIIFLAKDKPIPQCLLPELARGLSFKEKKGLKISFKLSGEIPEPLSSTETKTCPSRDSKTRETFRETLSLEKESIALLIKLINTCPNLIASPKSLILSLIFTSNSILFLIKLKSAPNFELHVPS